GRERCKERKRQADPIGAQAARAFLLSARHDCILQASIPGSKMGSAMRIAILRPWKPAAILLIALAASGCASGARTGAMIAPVTADTLIAENSPAHNAIAVNAVTGGHETNPMWMSKVSDDNFRQALEQTLKLHAMLAADHPRYLLTAELQSLSQPLIGLSMTVTSRVRYRLVTAADK